MLLQQMLPDFTVCLPHLTPFREFSVSFVLFCFCLPVGLAEMRLCVLAILLSCDVVRPPGPPFVKHNGGDRGFTQ